MSDRHLGRLAFESILLEAHGKLLIFKKSVYKDLRRLPKNDIKLILARINNLADNPRPPGSQKLTNEEKYRIRQGNYRILYTIEDRIITVTIVKVGHRRDIYR